MAQPQQHHCENTTSPSFGVISIFSSRKQRSWVIQHWHSSVMRDPSSLFSPTPSPKPYPCRAVQLLVARSLRAAQEIYAEESRQTAEEGREGRHYLNRQRSSTMSEQNKATDEADFHNRPFTVQEIVLLTRALLSLIQLVLQALGGDWQSHGDCHYKLIIPNVKRLQI